MQTYFFDLDGTLSDSRGGLFLSFRAALRALEISDLDDNALNTFLGTPLPEMFRALRPSISDTDIETGMSAFRTAFEAEGVYINALYPGVEEMLGALKSQGRGAWVVTSKPEKYARQVVSHLALERYVDGIVGAGLDETDTKETLIANALAQSGAAPGATVMLGDRHYDVIGALANGVMPVGALWGYGTREELLAAGCRRLINDIASFRRDIIDA